MDPLTQAQETLADRARYIIIFLLARGCSTLRQKPQDASVHVAEHYDNVALGYLQAANAVLHANPTLHKELIEHPNFVLLRRVQRGQPVSDETLEERRTREWREAEAEMAAMANVTGF